ncbi:MAG: hypothetical protein FIA97_06885 [Methylococcaceae bacterium]|nr:hypothetical protein [Methylococcaceae bacterium]
MMRLDLPDLRPNRGLRRELTIVVVVKFLILALLWYLVFRHDPATRRASPVDLFAASQVSSMTNNGAAP